ncbi:glycosyltransferase [Nostocoides vanveenii]|uniref:Bifunctional glycosyltransferase family 2/GtrA family protein n=1 Tax=Nostocoides vanveenii TaxID=330835 RepID=A0ABN2K3L5_9MICO
MIVLIPSYEPDGRLPQLVADLGGTAPVVVVDDGSGPAYGPVFAECARRGAVIVTHPENRGKGAALKTGFAYAGTHFPGESVVCADSDGQHSPVDILRVADELADGEADLVLGARLFTGEVPLRSRFGNAVTGRLFAAATRRRLIDTQTGLRAVPARSLAWLCSIPGDRFEYELRVLLRAVADGLTIREVEIATIYLDENASSHFRPARDSVMIYRQLFAFVASSLVGFALDATLLFAGVALTGNVTASAVGARLLSGTANFTMNRRWAFRSGGTQAPLWRSVRRYAALAAVILAANVLLLHALSGLLGSLLLAKLGTEVALFVASFLIQRTGVFAPARTPKPRSADREPAGV